MNSTNDIYYKQIDKWMCKITCDKGQFSSSSDNMCYLCSSFCTECVNYANNCTRCNNLNNIQFYLYQNNCVNNCPDGYYKTNNTNNFICSICDIACKICFGLDTNCTVCKTNYYFDTINNRCALTCP